MWTITKIVADFEGWWLFDDWKTYITEEESFNTYDEMIEEYSSKIYTAIDKYDNYIVGKYN
ncbi:hypothetical protein CD133_06715, partial [Staphylococcus massiliensis CCUG 55927]